MHARMNERAAHPPARRRANLRAMRDDVARRRARAPPRASTDGSRASTEPATPSTSHPSPSRSAVIARCSWCFHVTSHAAVTRSARADAPRACGACAGRTRACARFATCRAMARGGDGWDDRECLACAGALTKRGWDDGFDAGALELGMSPRGRCSWCGDETRHRATRAAGRRGTRLSHCAACARATHRCERCGDGFAKIGDGRCARCAGWIEGWTTREAFAAATRTTAWCSWCGERSAHARRGIKGGRDAFECMVCGGGTAPCERCGEAAEVMRKRSRPGGGSCARCAAAETATRRINIGGHVSVPTIGALANAFKRALSRGDDAATASTSAEEIARGWDLRLAKREAADERAGFIFDVLDRESDYRDKAYRAGLIRPFLLLATLPPRERVRLGMRLGVTLCRSSAYLDPHAEAWKLLRDPVCGLQTRGGSVSRVVEKVTGVGRGANWIDILYSALTLGADTGKCPATDPSELDALPKFRSTGHAMFALRVASHPALSAFEVATLRLVGRAQRGRLAPASTIVLDGVCRHPRMATLRSRLAKAYPRHADEVSRHAVTCAFASSEWASTVRPSSPGDVEETAEDVFGMLLDGAPFSRRGGAADEDVLNENADAHLSRGAPSLLGSLAAATSIGLASYAAAQFAPKKFAVLTPRDIMDLTTGVRTPTLTSSGIFEPVAVMLIHNVLARREKRARGRALAGRSVAIVERRSDVRAVAIRRRADARTGERNESRVAH